MLLDVRRMMSLVIGRDNERVISLRLKAAKLLAAHLQKLVHVLLRLPLLCPAGLRLLILICHLAPFL
jgi:hypothetical protein